jgi:hypothetical protein
MNSVTVSLKIERVGVKHLDVIANNLFLTLA